MRKKLLILLVFNWCNRALKFAAKVTCGDVFWRLLSVEKKAQKAPSQGNRNMNFEAYVNFNEKKHLQNLDSFFLSIYQRQ